MIRLFSPGKLDKQIAAAADLVNVARPQLEASQLQRYGNIALKLGDVCGRLYVPNMRSGVVSIPRKYRDSDGVSLIAMDRMQRPALGKGFYSMSPRQIGAMTSQLIARGNSAEQAAKIASSLNKAMTDSNGPPAPTGSG